MKRLQLRITDEMASVLAALRGEPHNIESGTLIEEALRRLPVVKKVASELGIDLPERQKKGRPKKIVSEDV